VRCFAATIIGAVLIANSGCGHTSGPGALPGNGIPVVLAHPPFDGFFSCSEHFAGQFEALGDALGADCTSERLESLDGRFFARAYRGLGLENEDWYGWNQPVLAPCRGEVMRLHINPVTNRPGTAGRPPASSVTVRCQDGTHFLYAHIQAPAVSVGQRVVAGQELARVGNNGYGRSPHVHIGVWMGSKPLQIRWDQTKMTLPPEFQK
jgi:hypothetical protein